MENLGCCRTTQLWEAGPTMEKRDTPGARPNRESAAELLPPNPIYEAGRALSAWIADHPGDPAAGGVRILKDHNTVLVYWKGTVPPGLQSLAARQPVPVTFQPAAYSSAELAAAVHAVMVNNPDVASAGFLSDYSGIKVTLSSKAPPNALAAVKASSTIPIVLRGIGDPKPLDQAAEGAGNGR
jgi:hypothetical protein